MSGNDSLAASMPALRVVTHPVTRGEAGMAGARATAAVLAGLPAVGVGLGQLIGADPVSFLLSGGIGGWLLVVGVLLACGGLLWSDRITAGVLR